MSTGLPTKIQPINLIFGTQLNVMTLIKILEYIFFKSCLIAVISCFNSCLPGVPTETQPIKLKFGLPQLSPARFILMTFLTFRMEVDLEFFINKIVVLLNK